MYSFSFYSAKYFNAFDALCLSKSVKAQIFGFALHDKKIRFFSVWLVFSSPAQLSVFPSAEVTDLLHFLYQNIFSIVRLKALCLG
jgi:hypothetical protein